MSHSMFSLPEGISSAAPKNGCVFRAVEIWAHTETSLFLGGKRRCCIMDTIWSRTIRDAAHFGCASLRSWQSPKSEILLPLAVTIGRREVRLPAASVWALTLPKLQDRFPEGSLRSFACTGGLGQAWKMSHPVTAVRGWFTFTKGFCLCPTQLAPLPIQSKLGRD